jgi:D-alanyl-D-alanine carboxypeptidase
MDSFACRTRLIGAPNTDREVHMSPILASIIGSIRTLLLARPVVAAVTGSCLLVGGGSAVAVRQVQLRQDHDGVVASQEAVSRSVAPFRSAQDALRAQVTESETLLTQAAAEDTTAAARSALSAAVDAARPLLADPATGTVLDPSAITASIATLRAVHQGLADAHAAWLAADLAAQQAAATQLAAAAQLAAADKATAEKAAAAAKKPAPVKAAASPAPVASAYDGTNGKINPALLCTIPSLPDHQILCRALPDLVAFSNAFRAQFGIDLPLDPWPESCYRTYDQQVATFARFGSPQAAIPGTSNHGWGKAFDINDIVGADGQPVYGFGTPGYDWMKANGPKFGWATPTWAYQNGGNPEAFHFEYVR